MLEKKIIPAILTDSLDDLKQQVQRVENVTDIVQVDYVDGFFAPELTCCEANLIQEIEIIPGLEVHLMVVEPIDQVQDWHRAGATRLIGHIEEMDDQIKFVETVSGLGMEVGLALNVETPLTDLDEELIDNLDVVLLMAHKVGVQHVPFQKQILAKIKNLRQEYPSLNIEIDGGMNEETIPLVSQAGANWFAVGSAIFDQSDPEASFHKLQKMIREGKYRQIQSI